MKYSKNIGVLAFHGDVIEHIKATQIAAKILDLQLEAIEVRTLGDLSKIDGLIIPGGESTTLHKLCERENMFESMKKIRNIFGTCAGAILLAKKIQNKIQDQKTLELMDIDIDRNAYGRQTDSFEIPIKSAFGNLNAVFIRAPKIQKVGKDVKVLAQYGEEVIACEQKRQDCFYLAACFHPELTTSLFHEYFLSKIYSKT